MEGGEDRGTHRRTLLKVNVPILPQIQDTRDCLRQIVPAQARIIESLPNWVYVSFDIDGLDPLLCPSTGTPVPGGLSFNEAAILLKRVVDSGVTIVGFDLNEVAPGPDGDEWDANVGARMLYKLCSWMLKSWE